MRRSPATRRDENAPPATRRGRRATTSSDPEAGARAAASGVAGVDDRFVVVEDVRLAFGDKKVLEGVSIEIRKGDTLAIFGESGSGKTVLLRVILGLQKPDSGRVLLFGTDIADLDDEAMEPMRKRLAVVYQAGALYTAMTVAENIALELKEVLELAEGEIRKRVRESLDAVGLEEVKPDLLPDELSGGMKKRLAVARAIAPHPELIFYDEPTSGLDPINSARILELIRDLHDRMGVTSVVVTHDLKGAAAICNRVALIAQGVVAFDGTPDEFLASTDERVVSFRQAAPSFAEFAGSKGDGGAAEPPKSAGRSGSPSAPRRTRADAR